MHRPRWLRQAASVGEADLAAAAAAESPLGKDAPGGRNPVFLPAIKTHRLSKAGLQHEHVARVSETPGPAFPWQPQRETTFRECWQAMLKPFARARSSLAHYTWLDWLQLVLPCVRWLRTYRIREFLLWDVVAGISVGFMVVPQGMSYANIAGVPSVYGLYGAFLPVLVYAVFGSSRELAVGPVAVTSLLISSSLKAVVPGADEITNPNNPPPHLVAVQESYNRHAIQLSLLVACMYTAVGALNLGFLTNFLSHSVIGGFTSGAAIIIGMSQLKYILGYSVPRADKVHEAIRAYIAGAAGFKWREFVMGSCLLMFLLTIKHFGKHHPRLKWMRPLGPISACVISIIAVAAGHLEQHGIRVVGNIPRGLPSPTVSWWFAPAEDFARLAPLAVVVMLVDLLESTSIARALAAKGGYDLHANQEIVGLGLANFAGSAFNAYSTTGSFSRSAVNYDSGCKTGLAGFVTACVVGLVLLVMTPVFSKLPLNVMGAIVISGVSGLFEYEQALHLFKVRKLDWLVWMTSFVSTMFAGVEIGLAISIGLALLIVVYESAFPHTALLGRVGATTIYRNVKQFPDSQVLPGIVACRIDAPIYFANVSYISERLAKYVARGRAYSSAAGLALQYLLLDMSPVTHLDSTGADLLEKLHREMKQQGVQLALCNPNFAVIRLLERTGFPDQLGRGWIFVRMHDAITTCLAAMVGHGQAVLPTPAIESAAVSPRLRAAMAGSASPVARAWCSRGGAADTSDAGSGAVILGLAGHPAVAAVGGAAGGGGGAWGEGPSPGCGGGKGIGVGAAEAPFSGTVVFANGGDGGEQGVAGGGGVGIPGGGRSSGGGSGLISVGSAALGLLDALVLAAGGSLGAGSGGGGAMSQHVASESPLAGRYQQLPGGAAGTAGEGPGGAAGDGAQSGVSSRRVTTGSFSGGSTASSGGGVAVGPGRSRLSSSLSGGGGSGGSFVGERQQQSALGRAALRRQEGDEEQGGAGGGLGAGEVLLQR